ncbi:MAG: 50S ribosomal protein L7 [Oscillospiraceae bacterium]
MQEITAPKSKAAGIILAADLSPKTEKEIRFQAERCGTPVVQGDFTMDEAKDAVGKRTGIFLVLDAGLYGSITKHITDKN